MIQKCSALTSSTPGEWQKGRMTEGVVFSLGEVRLKTSWRWCELCGRRSVRDNIGLSGQGGSPARSRARSCLLESFGAKYFADCCTKTAYNWRNHPSSRRTNKLLNARGRKTYAPYQQPWLVAAVEGVLVRHSRGLRGVRRLRYFPA